MIRLNLPDGTVANFPDDTPPDVMKQAAQQYLVKLAADQGEQGAGQGAAVRRAQAERSAGGGPPLPIEAMRTVPGEMGEQITPEHSSRLASAGIGLASIPLTMAATPIVASTVPAAAPVVAAALGKPGQATYGAYQGYKYGGGVGGALLGAGAAVAGVSALGKIGAKILPFLRSAVPAAEGAVVGAEAAAAKATPEAAKAIATELGVTRDVAKQIITPVAPAVEAEAAQAVAQVAPSAAKALTQEELKLIAQLRGIAQSSGPNKIQVVQAAQKVWPDSWKEMVKLIMAPRTTMPTIYQP